MLEANFCECCGRPLKDITAELEKIPFDKKKQRTVNGHTQYEGHPEDIYSKSLIVSHCCICGTKLDDESIRTISECVGMMGLSRACQQIVVGYKCQSCKSEIKF